MDLTFCKEWVFCMLEVERGEGAGSVLTIDRSTFNNNGWNIHQLHPAENVDGP